MLEPSCTSSLSSRYALYEFKTYPFRTCQIYKPEFKDLFLFGLDSDFDDNMRPAAVHVVHVRTDHPSIVSSHDCLLKVIVVGYFLDRQIEHDHFVLQRIVCHRQSSQLRREKIIHLFIVDFDYRYTKTDAVYFGK